MELSACSRDAEKEPGASKAARSWLFPDVSLCPPTWISDSAGRCLKRG